MLGPMVPLKDEMLSRLAAEANVAQFVSFGPGAGLPQRHSCLRGHRPDHRFDDAAQAVGALFGRPTGAGERWLRTCPAEPVPGRFLTQRGWRDPFALLAAEDPSVEAVVAVLAQEGVPARCSTTSGGSGTGPPPPSARSASSGPTTATSPGSSSSTWPRWPPPPPPSTPIVGVEYHNSNVTYITDKQRGSGKNRGSGEHLA